MNSPKQSAKACSPDSPDNQAQQRTPEQQPDVNAIVPQATPKRYVAGVAFQIIGRCGQAAAALAIMALLTRKLGIAAVGVFASWEAIFTLLDVVVDGGSGNAIVRRGGATPSAIKGLLKRALRFRIVTAALASVCVFSVAQLDSRISPSDPSLLICTIGLWFHLFGTSACIFNLNLDFRFPSIVRISSAVLGLSFALILFSHDSLNPLDYLAAIAIARMFGNLAIWLGARPLINKRPDHSPATSLIGFEREAISLGIGWFVRESYGRLDIIALRTIAGPAAAGIYAPIRKTFTLAMQVPAFINNVAMPSLASQAKSAVDEYSKHVKVLARNLTLFVIPAALLIWPFAYLYLDLAFGSEYGAQGVEAMWVLIGAGVFVFPTSVFITALIARGDARQALIVSAIALCTCIVGNLLWVPEHDVFGAALARLATEFAALLAAIYFVRKRSPQG